MDLKEAITSVTDKVTEAHNSFHAGHQIEAQRYLSEISEVVQKYFDEKGMLARDVTESATKEKQAELPGEKQAAVPGAPAQPAVVDPAAAALQIGQGQAGSKQTQ